MPDPLPPVPPGDSKYTPERLERIRQALAAGNTRRAAARYAGICKTTLYNWMRDHEEAREIVEQAEADAEVRHVANIAKAANDGSWQASAWWLERIHAEEWGKKDKHEHSGPGGGPIPITEVIVEHQPEEEEEDE